MKLIPIEYINDDNRLFLTAFRPPPDFPPATEIKVLVAKVADMCLDNHSHPRAEAYLLVSGECGIKACLKDGGTVQTLLTAPRMFMFAPGEEHTLTCASGTILVSYMPAALEEGNSAPASRL